MYSLSWSLANSLKIRSKTPLLAHRLKRWCTIFQSPKRAGIGFVSKIAKPDLPQAIRIGRCEAGHWRQLTQTLLILNSPQRVPLSPES
jgi:hypothetical protein